MKNVKMHLITLLGVLVACNSVAFEGVARAANPTIKCQVAGPGEICRETYDSNLNLVDYAGYLLQEDGDIFVNIRFNGRSVTAPVTRSPRGGALVAEALSVPELAGNTPVDIEFYFYNSRGQYDSNFGKNYRMMF